MTNYFKTIRDWEEYRKLSFEEKLRTYLFEGEVLKIPVLTIDEPMIDIRDFDYKFEMAERLKDFRTRKVMAEKLARINEKMKTKGLGLKIYELYRPLSQQKKEFDQIWADMAIKNPGLAQAELWAKVTEFIADPKFCPPHSTGGAVDLVPYNLDSGKELEMGSPINEIDEKAALFCPDISPEAKANRAMLLEMMLGEELAPMCTEWWHYSYGDAYWAAIYDKNRILESLDL